MILKLRKEYGKLEEYIYEGNDSFTNIIEAPRPKVKGGHLLLDELPSTTRDKIFKRMFAQEETKEYACLLFSTILDVSKDKLTSNMNLYTNEFVSKLVDGGDVRVDFIGKCEGVFFSLEMNNSNKLERNANYAGILYGFESKNKIYRSVVQMNINNFTIRGINKTINISVTKGGEVRRTKIIYIDIYLPILLNKYRNEGPDALTDGERTILTMFTPSIREARKLAKGDEEMLRFIEKLKNFKKDEKVMKDYYKDDDLKDSFIGRGIEIGREEGREEGLQKGMQSGLQKGREETQLETAKTMLTDGIPPETVQKYTKLSADKIAHIMTML